MNKNMDLHQQIEQLQEENKSLLKQIDDINKKLIESETFKSHFLSNVTNEIINPFASIMGLSQQIMALKKEEHISKAIEIAGLIFSEAASLDFQLRNIFMAARLEAGEEKPEPAVIDMPNLIRETIGKVEHEADEKDLKFHVQIDSSAQSIVSDKEKLGLILLNLLNNAVKFSNPGKSVSIRVHLDNNIIKIEVTDEGMGMTKEEINRVFDRFHRANPVIQSVTPGTGLGLSVVEGLLFILNGKADIDSTPGKGTSILISIPQDSMENIDFDEDLFFDDQSAESF